MAKKQLSDAVRREIEVRAYLIWESEGKPHGCEVEHWQRAEAEILGAKPAKKAVSAKANGSTKAAANGVAKAVVAVKAKRAAKPKTSKPAHR